MAVVLSVLKIIGIVLLAILGLLLFLILLVSLVPIHYSGAGRGNFEKLEGEARVWILFHAFQVILNSADPEGILSFRLFGKRLKPKEKKGPEHEEGNEKEEKEHVFEENPGKNPGEASPDPAETSTDDREGDAENGVVCPETGDCLSGDCDDAGGAPGFLKKLKRWRKLLGDETTGEAVQKLWKSVLKILKHIAPRKAEGFLRFGFNSPADTGMALGALAAFFVWNKGKIEITPDFSGAALDFDLKISGFLLIGYLLIAALSVVLNAKVRKTYKRLKTLQKLNEEGEKNGK